MRLQLLRCSRTTDDAGMTANILIFHHPITRSVRIVWLCEELGLKYDLDVITVYMATVIRQQMSLLLGMTNIELYLISQRKLQDLKQIKTDEYKQKNPNGLLPAVKIENDFFYESGAIMQIILERFANGKLMPAPNTGQRGAHDKQLLSQSVCCTAIMQIHAFHRCIH